MRLSISLAAITALPLFLASCSQPAVQEIPVVREPGEPRREAPPKLNTAQRLDMKAMGMAADDAAADALGGITFHHEMPEGWEAVPKTELRQVNLRMTETPEAECYFTLLPGGGGGVAANLNRWRGQMGQDPLSPEAIAALPTKPMFGQEGTFILIDGAYSGMGTEAKEDYRMYGLILSHTDAQTGREQAFFLKMTGPRDVLEGQEKAFDQIAQTLHAVMPGDDHTHDHDGGEHSDHDGHDHGAEGHDGHDHGAEGAHSDHDGHDHGAEGHDGHDHAEATPLPDGHGAVTGDAAPGFHWTVPAGWEELAPSMMRQANLTITGQPDVECYFTVLAGSGGGLEMNINRWQRQMGQPDLTSEQIAALPRHPLLGGDATFVTIDGTFGGMGGDVQKENFRMYGLVHVDETQAFFVKMTGPQTVLADQEANFLAFSASIQPGAPATPAVTPETAATPDVPADPGAMAADAASGAFDPEALQWTAPEGWQDGGERMMRLVTYTIGDVECYITSLQGDAGGVDANINRWVGQMGQEALDEAALAALPRIAILGQEAPLVEVGGKFTDMAGAEKDAYKLLGTVLPMGDQTLFVKMTGPGAEVDAQKQNFITFCGSLH